MKYLLMRCLFIFLLCASVSLVYAQKRGKPPKSSNTDWSVNNARPPKAGKKVRVIYKRELKKEMRPGSKCVDDLTRKKGYRYEQVPNYGAGSMTQEGIFFHNLGTKTILLFRNGPFWEIRTRNRVKNCQKKTGDYMG